MQLELELEVESPEPESESESGSGFGPPEQERGQSHPSCGPAMWIRFFIKAIRPIAVTSNIFFQ